MGKQPLARQSSLFFKDVTQIPLSLQIVASLQLAIPGWAGWVLQIYPSGLYPEWPRWDHAAYRVYRH